MKKILPLLAVVIVLVGAGYFVLKDNTAQDSNANVDNFKLEEFGKIRSCSRMPSFLYRIGIKRPVIDLTQLHYKGIAFYYGAKFNRVLHKKEWERYDALGTYTIDNYGNIYLTPNPFISIKDTTFNLQKAIYKMDSKSGQLTRWMEIDDIKPNSANPYGLISIVYDCDNKTLVASSIDESNYKSQKGVIYQIDPKNKDVINRVEGFDALTVNLLHSKNHKYLIAGNARDNGVYAFEYNNGKLDTKAHKLFELPNPRLRVRKIKIIDKNRLKIESIKFNYSLVAETNKKQRYEYIATYNPTNSTWSIASKKSTK